MNLALDISKCETNLCTPFSEKVDRNTGERRQENGVQVWTGSVYVKSELDDKPTELVINVASHTNPLKDGKTFEKVVLNEPELRIYDFGNKVYSFWAKGLKRG